MAFNITDIVLLLGISQGLFLSVSLRLIHNRNKSANVILSLLLLIAVVMLFGRIAAFRVPEEWVWRFGVFIDTTIFLFGPWTYLYVRRLVFTETPIFKLATWHYVPAFLHLAYYFWSLSFPIKEFNALYFSGKLNLLFFIVETAGLISLSFYLVKTYILVRKYAKMEKTALSFQQNVLVYLRVLLFTLGLFGLLWSISFLSTHFFKSPFRYVNYVTMWISTPLFIYGIGYFSLRQPAIFRIPFKPKSENDRLKPEEIKKLQKRLHYFMEEEKVYVQPDLTLKGLADKLDTSPNNLSWLLNQVYQKSFYTYINTYRIDEFLKKIARKEHSTQTLLALALDVGFNSKSTFNRVFKSILGTTPKEYLKSDQVA